MGERCMNAAFLHLNNVNGIPDYTIKTIEFFSIMIIPPKNANTVRQNRKNSFSSPVIDSPDTRSVFHNDHGVLLK